MSTTASPLYEAPRDVGAYLAGQESVENASLGCRCLLPWADPVPITPNKVPKRHALQCLRIARQFMSVSFSLGMSCPFQSIPPERKGFGHRSHANAPDLDLPLVSMPANSRHRTSSCDHSVTSSDLGLSEVEEASGYLSPFEDLDGGRTRDRTLDLSRVKGTLSR
jgi:hypothetical protein